MTEKKPTYLEQQLEAVIKKRTGCYDFHFSKGKNQVR